ncbi:nucleotidyltransferase domain-containing protein [Methylobacterium sp.]|uniref:nucleotidyltransferase domain-containing protein n=1 Tax=Methylobacterium sp. TaxID=409 RepID=UPI00258D35CB|nr:nucleotidyltransferase domain-containing protein [Methylobacterium sp.]
MTAKNFEDKLLAIGVAPNHARTFFARRHFSQMRVEELIRRFDNEISDHYFPRLAIYAAGSFARGEASKYSDIDLFFVHDDRIGEDIKDPKLREIVLMSKIIENVQQGMRMPPPSNDGEFLKILQLKDMLDSLGGRHDDYKNHFTTRMLLLLESVPLLGMQSYENIVSEIINSYLRDYENHAENFRPTFLVNDILRFWKTLCLNYEHRRNIDPHVNPVKQKVKNFKLGYSRLMTCFATVGLLSSYNTIDKSELIALCKLPPLDRLLLLVDRNSHVVNPLREALMEYHWFLEKTEQSTEDLEKYFSNRENKIEAFSHSGKFGDAMFKVVQAAAQESGTMRYLVV